MANLLVCSSLVCLSTKHICSSLVYLLTKKQYYRKLYVMVNIWNGQTGYGTSRYFSS